MPHRRVDLLAFARGQPSRRVLQVVALLSLAAGCRGNHSDATVIVLDSSSGRDSLEVVALPVDPASFHASGVAPDSTMPAATEADSVSALDIHLRQERSALNAEAVALGSGDRRSAEYSRRFDAWHRRAMAVDSLRALRDKPRARLRPAQLLAASGKSTLRATMLRVTSNDGRAAIVRALVPGDSVSLGLSRGDWWVGVAAPGGVPSNWVRATGRRLALRP